MNCKIVYPHVGDSVDVTYYSYQAPYFYSFFHRHALANPNTFYVFGNKGIDWSGIETGLSYDTTSVSSYRNTYDIQLAPEVTSSDDLNDLAAAARDRALAEIDYGTGIVPHDSRIELYDFVQFADSRVSSRVWPSYSLARVCGLTHIYRPGVYTLTINIGGVSNDYIDAYAPVNFNILASQYKPLIDVIQYNPANDPVLQARIKQQAQQLPNITKPLTTFNWARNLLNKEQQQRDYIQQQYVAAINQSPEVQRNFQQMLVNSTLSNVLGGSIRRYLQQPANAITPGRGPTSYTSPNPSTLQQGTLSTPTSIWDKLSNSTRSRIFKGL
jgi:hypothetical protein